MLYSNPHAFEQAIDNAETRVYGAGKSERAIMLQTGHKNPPMVHKYIRSGSILHENVAAEVGL